MTIAQVITGLFGGTLAGLIGVLTYATLTRLLRPGDGASQDECGRFRTGPPTTRGNPPDDRPHTDPRR